MRILGKSPDGDSIRFVPDDLDTLRGLPGGHRVEPSTADGSVQLRLDAIDAPETHYAGQHQPFAVTARDELVEFAGFSGVSYNRAGTVTAGEPAQQTALIAAKLVEAHGRPVSYLFTDLRALDPPLAWSEGQTVGLEDVHAAQTVNAHMISTGRAYTTLYTSTPPGLRDWFVDLARKANTTGQNVWADDHSRGFDLVDRDSIGEHGVLVLPKLFRRATDYLTAKARGDATSFLGWLLEATSGGASEDDQVEVAGRRVAFSELIGEQGPRIAPTRRGHHRCERVRHRADGPSCPRRGCGGGPPSRSRTRSNGRRSRPGTRSRRLLAPPPRPVGQGRQPARRRARPRRASPCPIRPRARQPRSTQHRRAHRPGDTPTSPHAWSSTPAPAPRRWPRTRSGADTTTAHSATAA